MIDGKPLRSGQEPIPGYRLTQLLGKGSISEVWEAKRGETFLALKVLPVEDRQVAAAELRAIQNLAGLEHARLTVVEQAWILPGFLVIAMEKAEGTLQDYLELHQQEFNSPLDVQETCRLLKQVADALDFLNAVKHPLVGGRTVGFQHSDIKPSNLLLFDDYVKLSDFNLSVMILSGSANHARRSSFDFAPPEVFQGQISDRTDQYSLAATYVKLRTGKLPFPPYNPKGSWPRRRPAPDLSGLAPQEQPIIGKAMSTKPQERWANCKEMMNQLDLAW